jgi:hypothetical protein
MGIGAALWLAVPTTGLAAGDANSPVCPREASSEFREYMADCRAYEMVTPAYKGGSEVLLGLKAVASDGSRLIGTSYGGFGGIENNEQGKPIVGAGVYEFSRTSTGWQAEPLEPAAYQASSYVAASADVSTTLWELAEEASPGVELYTAEHRQRLALRVHEPGSAPRFEPIGREDSPTETSNRENFRFGGVSADLSHVLYTIEARNSAIWPGDETHGGRSLYEYVGLNNAEPLLVGVKNEGRLKGSRHLNEDAQLVSRCGTELGAYGFSASKYNAVSEDGRTVFFTASACGGEPAASELYARVDEERTVAISEPGRPISPEQGSGLQPQECDAVCQAATPQEAVFQGASQDGTKVFFTTAQPLLNEDENGEGAGEDLYEAELREGRLARLVQVSHDPHDGEQADVQGVARISATGRRVYFVAGGALTGANGRGQAPAVGEHNLYVYDAVARTLTFVAALAGGDEADWQAEDHRPFQTTPDGRFAVLRSSSHLTADDTSGVAQLFEYDAETESIARVSIGQHSPSGYLCAATKRLEAGYNCDGNTASPSQVPVIPRPNYSASSLPTEADSTLSLTEDGRVFFMSRDALTPFAVEGSKNIYEYSGEDVYLIAPGEDPQLEYGAFQESFLEHDRLVSTDESGTDLFFGAVGQLVPQDSDTQADVYDARVGGGFSAPVLAQSCEGQACRPAAGGAGAALVSPPSAALPGEEAVPVPTPAVPASPAKAKPLARTQRLAAALRACRRRHGRARRRCEAQARRRYRGKRS